MWNARREICFRKRVFFRTLQLQCIVGAVHVSAQCSMPRIYEHQARSHIHLDSHIPAHTCSHQLTSAHHYSSYIYLHQDDQTQTNIFSDLRNSARLHEATFIWNSRLILDLLKSAHINSYLLTTSHIYLHQTARISSYLPTFSHIYSLLLTSARIFNC